MFSLIGGIIVLLILVFVCYIFMAPLFNKIGGYINKKLEPFKIQEEEKKDEQI
jgi:hypothetical protein